MTLLDNRHFVCRLLVLITLLAAGVCAVPAAGAGVERLVILSYNIHHGEGVDGKLDLERIARIIRSEAPDLVALQEVDRGTRRTRAVDQPAELARLTGMHVMFGKNIDHEDGDYGNAILSKRPLELRENVSLPSLSSNEVAGEPEQRGALVVEVKSRSGRRLLFVSTHLDHRRQHDERIAGAKKINDWFRRMAGDRPAILAGDLNATPESGVLKEFEELWVRAGDGPLATVPVSAPRRQIDYILYRPADRWRVVSVRVLDERIASDHRPMVAVLELLPVN